jgi:methylmalonyl-CoA carboxyltransferase large subunit
MIEAAMKTDEIAGILEAIRAELVTLSERVTRVETAGSAAVARLEEKVEGPAPEAKVEGPAPEAPSQAPAAAPEVIPADDLLAMAAALAAYFGVRVHVRAIRLISSAAWAQQGRVTIQASHRLDH